MLSIPGAVSNPQGEALAIPRSVPIPGTWFVVTSCLSPAPGTLFIPLQTQINVHGTQHGGSWVGRNKLCYVRVVGVLWPHLPPPHPDTPGPGRVEV